MSDLTGKYIRNTYQGVLQISESNRLYDGTGSLRQTLNVTASWAANAPVGNYATTGSNTFVGNQTITGSLYVSESMESHYIDFTDGNEPSYKEGRLYYSDSDGTLSMKTNSPNVTLQIGQEIHVRIRNRTGGTLLNGRAVYIVSASAGYPHVDYIDVNTTGKGKIAGILTEDIANNGLGYMTFQGLVRDVDTSAFLQGDPLWTSGSQGEYDNKQVPSPAHSSRLGYVLYNHATNGVILVQIENMPHFNHLHDVCNCVTGSDGSVPFYSELNKNFSGSYNRGFTIKENGVQISGSLVLTGSIVRNNKTIASNYSVLTTDDVIFANTATNFSASLYDAAGQDGRTLTFKIVGNGNLTIEPSGSQTIDEENNLIITDKFVSVDLIASGANWYII